MSMVVAAANTTITTMTPNELKLMRSRVIDRLSGRSVESSGQEAV
jgi:hypothetical protein